MDKQPTQKEKEIIKQFHDKLQKAIDEQSECDLFSDVEPNLKGINIHLEPLNPLTTKQIEITLDNNLVFISDTPYIKEVLKPLSELNIIKHDQFITDNQIDKDRKIIKDLLRKYENK